ncbi:MAG: tetratricopeptide repeat protein [Puniceicoccales bacterium]|nr:tetratricopeptide repeat protein [Puniceicoccales bacterium]
MSKSIYLVSLLILMGGCVRRVHDPISPQQLALKSPQREQIAEAIFKQAEQAQAQGCMAKAMQQYQIICKKYAETDIAPQARYAMGHLYIQAGQYAKGVEHFQFIAHNYIQYEHYDDVVKEQFEVAEIFMQGCEKHRLRFLPWGKDTATAVAFFQGVISMAPYTDYAPRALFYTAQLEFEDNHKVKAIEALDRLIEDYPGHRLVPEAYLLKGDIYLSLVYGPQNDQGATQKAIQCYENFLILFEKSHLLTELIQRAQGSLRHAQELFAQSRLVLGDFFLYKRHYGTGAIQFYNEAQLIAPSTDIAMQANKRIESIYTHASIPTTWADKIFGIFQHVPPTPAPLQ